MLFLYKKKEVTIAFEDSGWETIDHVHVKRLMI